MASKPKKDWVADLIDSGLFGGEPVGKWAKPKYNPNDCPTGPQCFDCGNDCPGYNWGPNVKKVSVKPKRKVHRISDKRGHRYDELGFMDASPLSKLKKVTALMCRCGKVRP